MAGVENLHSEFIPLIWQGDTGEASPSYSVRKTYYNVGGIPHAQFQGTEDVVGGGGDMTNNYASVYNQIIGTDAPVEISSVVSGSAGEYSISASVSESGAVDGADVKVVFVMTRHISDEYFCSVVAYEEVAYTGAGSYSHNFSVNSSWSEDDLKAYVLVQNLGSGDKTIYNAAECGSGAVSVTDIAFGDIYIGRTVSSEFQVINISSESQDINVTLSGDGYTLDNSGAATLAAGEIGNYTLTFEPTADQAYNGTITVTTGIEGFENNTINITGVGFTNHAPVANNISMTGIVMTNNELEVNWDFEDEDSDNQGDTTIEWFESADGENWESFTNPGQNILKLFLEDENIGKWYKIEITPIDEHTMPGEMVSVATSQAVIDLLAPSNFRLGDITDSSVQFLWDDADFPEMRSLFGYKIVANSTIVKNLTNPDLNEWVLEASEFTLEEGTYEFAIRSIYTPGGLSPVSEQTVTLEFSNGGFTTANSNDVDAIVATNSAPNPFSNSTSIVFSIKRGTNVNVSVYNLKGQLINTLMNQDLSAGNHVVEWNGRDRNGSKCASGVYFYRISSPSKTVSRKVVLIK